MKKDNDKHLKAKIIISIVLVGLLLVSFLFFDKINETLGLDRKLSAHQASSVQVESSSYYVSYIDVGQGNSSFIKLPDGKTMLIDGGNTSYGVTVSNFLNKHNVSTIDFLVATHSDSDHIGGLNYVLEHYEVKNVYRPFQIAGTGTSHESFEVYEYEQLGYVYSNFCYDTMSRVTSNVYKTFIKNIYQEKYEVDGIEQNCRITVFYDGLVVSGENYEIKFFSPQKRAADINLIDYTDSTYGYATVGYGSSEANDNSSIFTVTCYNEKYLFMGDARYYEQGSTGTNYSELDFINSLTAAEKTELSKVDVLLAGHHGSKYSTSNELLNIVKPRFVIISCAEKNSYGHPSNEVLERIANSTGLETDYLLRTDKNGDIEFSSIDEKICYSLAKDDFKESYKITYIGISSTVVIIIIILMFSKKSRKKFQKSVTKSATRKTSKTQRRFY